MLVYNLPYDQLYANRNFGFDYPPLFALLEGFWGYILAYLSPKDMQFSMFLKESGYFYFLVRCTVIVTDLILFFTSLFLFRTFYRPRSPTEEPTRFNSPLFAFCICFMDVGLMGVDNGHTQYNSLLFSLIMLSVIFMYKQRVLLSALIYSLSILTKHITFFFSFGYVALLLLTYCFSIHQQGIRLNLLNSIKLAGVVLGSVVVVFFPYRHKLKQMMYFILGGTNNAQEPVPNIKFLYCLVQIPLTGWLTRTYLLPMPICVFLLFLSLLGICYLVYIERNLSEFRFPVYLFLSALSFVNFMSFVHEKHFIYTWVPLMIYSLYSNSQIFALMLEFKCLNALVGFNAVTGFDSLFNKLPLLVCSLVVVKKLLPLQFYKFVILCTGELLHDLFKIFFDSMFQPRYVLYAIAGIHLYSRLIKELLKPTTLKAIHTD